MLLLVLLLLRRRPPGRGGICTRMSTCPVPSMPGPGGTLHRSTVWDTISDCGGEAVLFHILVLVLILVPVYIRIVCCNMKVNITTCRCS